MNLNEYQLIDFVLDENFRRWVISPDAETDNFWIPWIQEHPDKEPLVAGAREVLLSLRVSEVPLSNHEIEQVVEDTIHKLSTDSVPDISLHAKRRSTIYWLSGVAALLAGLVITFCLDRGEDSVYRQLVKNTSEVLTEIHNAQDQPRLIRLDDGTVIQLEKNSYVSFPGSFKDKKLREVYLSGKAEFSVAKNPLKPFMVFANGVVTKVLGTKFSVNSIEETGKTTVEVASGIVSVSPFNLKDSRPVINLKKQDAIVLTRNQKAIYQAENQVLKASLSDSPKIADNRELQYQFENTGVKDVFDEIKSDYGIDIIYDEAAWKNKTLTVNLVNTTLFQKLEVICKVLNCRYEVVDRKIFISQQH